jgi:peptidoglycan/xylan/chitin deacetylase (PgdA/CDA1 family)
MSRRAVLAVGVAGVATAAGCSIGSGSQPAGSASAGSATAGSATAGSATAGPPAGGARRSARPASAAPGRRSGPAVEVVRGPRTRSEVALTFHGAGDPAIALGVLAAAAAVRSRITVLAVGAWLARYPDLARRIVGAGHELGNHTWSHPVLDELAAPAARVEIERCRDLLAGLTGSPGAHFRPSGGAHATALVRRLAAGAGYATCLSYDVDPRDFSDPGPAAVRARVAAAAQPGSIVSLHLGHPGTLAALPGVLADLTARGLRAVTATTLLRP